MTSPIKVVCLDAGHGGHDPGAINMRLGLTEANLALKVVKSIKPILERHGVKVVLTRSEDKALGKLTAEDLSNRARISNQAKADAFISVHMNGFDNSEAHGMEVFSFDGANTPELARAVHAEILKDKTLYKTDRGLKKENYAVLRETYCIACLVEMGFITNDEDAKRVETNAEAYALAIAKGILNYLGIKYKEVKAKNKAPKWYQNDVEEMKAEGLTTGERLDDPITRGEAIALINRLRKRITKKEGK